MAGARDFARGLLRHLRAHWLDWLLGIVMFVAAALFSAVVPFYKRTLVTDPTQEPDLHYPMAPSIVPTWLAGVLATIVPGISFIVVQFAALRVGATGPHDLHHAFLSLFSSLAIGQLMTQAMKVVVGRHRPNYYAWNKEDPGVRDANLSFPSGHSSISFGGFVIMSLYLAGKFRVYNSTRGRPLWMLLVTFLPLVVPCFVAVSRTMDYHHHFADILAGSIIGTGCAIAAYFHYYPALTSPRCDRPKSSMADAHVIYDDDSAINSGEDQSLFGDV